MTPQTALADGRLSDAVALQEAVVAAAPSDPAGRLFLVELLAVAGRFRDAFDHLRRIESTDPGWPKSRRRFARLLIAANRRTRLRRPVVLTDPPPHLRHRRAALRAEPQRAVRHIDRADFLAPQVLGHIDGREFEGLRDADDRLASVFELLVGRDWVWVPFEHLRRVTLAPADHLLDRVYRPARVRLADDEEFAAVVPLVYHGPADDEFLLGLDTDHARPDGGPVRGVGAKLLLAGDDEVPLAEVRQLDVRAWV